MRKSSLRPSTSSAEMVPIYSSICSANYIISLVIGSVGTAPNSTNVQSAKRTAQSLFQADSSVFLVTRLHAFSVILRHPSGRDLSTLLELVWYFQSSQGNARKVL